MPRPRKPLPSEKKYRTLDLHGHLTDPQDLPSWQDSAKGKYYAAKEKGEHIDPYKEMDAAEVFMTVVVPAYNEAKRLGPMLEETVNLLEEKYSNVKKHIQDVQEANGTAVRNRKPDRRTGLPRGWEILIIDDGSQDTTLEVAQQFTRTHLVPALPRRQSGPWTPGSHTQPSVNIPAEAIRMVTLERNRGKGGAVTHGMRHARGQYVLFADADGASDIKDLPKLVSACDEIADTDGRAIGVGSRAHMVNTTAVVQRSKLRNFLMHSFHLLLKLMTPPRTATIKDTQCGFKLFTRPTLPYIVPHMHMEGWIFDVEMLMIAEFSNIPVAEVAIGWKEVTGSKLNVIWDSLGMAYNLALLRICWFTGIYR